MNKKGRPTKPAALRQLRICITLAPDLVSQAKAFAQAHGLDFSSTVALGLQTLIKKTKLKNPPLQSNEQSEVPLESSSGGDATPALKVTTPPPTPETSPVDNRVPEKATPSQSNERSEVPIESLSEDDLFELGPDLSDTGSTSL